MDPSIECRAMAGPERLDALRLMRAFRRDERALGDALSLFVEREDYGFVWLAYREEVAVGCCSVGFGVSTAAGGLVAVVRDLYVDPAVRRTGVASALLDALEARLAGLELRATELAAAGDAAFSAFVQARRLRLTAGLFATVR